MRDSEAKLCADFLYNFNFEWNYNILLSKSPYFLWNKNINFNKDKTESQIQKAHRETNFELQLIRIVN